MRTKAGSGRPSSASSVQLASSARRLTDQEGQRLRQIVRRGSHESVRVRRAVIIMASASGTLVPSVALPRIEGMLTVGPQGISAPLLPVHQIDATYRVTGMAVAAVAALQAAAPVLGDLWDALDAVIDKGIGFRSRGVACGHAFFEMPDGRLFELVNRGFLDWRPASGDLLELLAQWVVRPVASDKYPTPGNLPPDKASGPVSARLLQRDASTA